MYDHSLDMATDFIRTLILSHEIGHPFGALDEINQHIISSESTSELGIYDNYEMQGLRLGTIEQYGEDFSYGRYENGDYVSLMSYGPSVTAVLEGVESGARMVGPWMLKGVANHLVTNGWMKSAVPAIDIKRSSYYRWQD